MVIDKEGGGGFTRVETTKSHDCNSCFIILFTLLIHNRASDKTNLIL